MVCDFRHLSPMTDNASDDLRPVTLSPVHSWHLTSVSAPRRIATTTIPRHASLLIGQFGHAVRLSTKRQCCGIPWYAQFAMTTRLSTPRASRQNEIRDSFPPQDCLNNLDMLWRADCEESIRAADDGRRLCDTCERRRDSVPGFAWRGHVV